MKEIAHAAEPKSLALGENQLAEWEAALVRMGRNALDETDSIGLIWFAYASLGLLVGCVAGLTNAEVTTTLLTLFFTFAGGSAIAFSSRLSVRERWVAASALAAVSLACLAGVVGGIWAREHRLLSPPVATWITDRAKTAELKSAEGKDVTPPSKSPSEPRFGYLRRSLTTEVVEVHQLVYSGSLTFDDAILRLAADSRQADVPPQVRVAATAIFQLYQAKQITAEDAYGRFHLH